MNLQTFLRHFKRVERRPVAERDFKDAIKQVLLAPQGQARSENREPTKAELEQGWRLDRQG